MHTEYPAISFFFYQDSFVSEPLWFKNHPFFLQHIYSKVGIEKSFWFFGREVETLYKLDLNKQVASLWGILNREVS